MSCVATPATEAAEPEAVCTAPVIGAAVISALVTYFGIAFLAARAMPHQTTPPVAIHEPTVAEAATS
ncbi:MAG TPA: hypothetical protein VHY20_00595, partial [Pirellulales bacterium]|nr:hypothetical protein [Pirellulales bacterium]